MRGNQPEMLLQYSKIKLKANVAPGVTDFPISLTCSIISLNDLSSHFCVAYTLRRCIEDPTCPGDLILVPHLHGPHRICPSKEQADS